MAKRMSRLERQEQTRAELLDAAAVAFAEHGLHGVSLDTIAERAGYTKGAIYSNFASKEDLFLELFERHFARARPASVEISRLVAEGNLDGARRRYAQFEPAPPTLPLLAIEFLLWASRDPKVKERAAQTLGPALEEVVEEQRGVLEELAMPVPGDLADRVLALVAVELGLELLRASVGGFDHPAVHVGAAARLLG